MRTRRSALTAVVAVSLGLAALGCDARPEDRPAADRPAILVFAAASTAEVIEQAAREFERARAVHVVTSFGASSTLARQIQAGAPADLFISADRSWMDELRSSGLVMDDAATELFGNALILVAPAGRSFPAPMSRGSALPDALRPPARLALADPAHVPAGKYARQALEHLAWWDAIRDRVIAAQDVRAALRLVEIGEADAAVVYATDAAASDRAVRVAEFPEEAHDPVRYHAALVGTAGPDAAAFLDFLKSSQMRSVYERRGFRVPADR